MIEAKYLAKLNILSSPQGIQLYCVSRPDIRSHGHTTKVII